MTYDTSAEADIRGLNIQKLVVGFSEGVNKFKKFCINSTTDTREIRWYKKQYPTGGWLTGTTTTGMTQNFMANTSSKARPTVGEPSFERQTSYVKEYFFESPLISDADIRDCDVSVFAVITQDLSESVSRQVDQRIINVITESYTPVNIQTQAATATWATVATCNPILDILNMEGKLRDYKYDPTGAILAMNHVEYKHFINYLISVKGSSIPAIASEAAKTGVVMTFLNKKIVVDSNVTTAYAIMFIENKTAEWKTFEPLTTAIVTEPLIGKKIRVKESGECLLLHPKSVVLLTGTA